METFELVLLLLVAVLISAVLERLIPKVSLPLVQIAIGFVIAIFAVNPISIGDNFDPEFFLPVFIAPILFHDAKECDKVELWRNRRAILSLAVGLVVVIMVAVGFTTHLLIPSIPLAAALALGAALGPTDAVAVSSLQGSAEVRRKESALLSGECLINDASGVVAFQFAIAAATTGEFAVVESSVAFVIEFFGGIALGIAVGALAHFISRRVDRWGLDSTTFHVMFDVTLPFIIYLLSEVVGVSGILAVVAAGIVVSSFANRSIGPAAAELSIVSNSTWSVLVFGLNGIVFTLLGMQLPLATTRTWNDVTIDNLQLLGYVLVITAILVGVRFLWVFAMNALSKDPATGKRLEPRRGRVRSALVTTIGGAKGAVTLSVIFSTPLFLQSGQIFPQRSLIIFLASMVILITLVLANFLLPILAPPDKAEDDSVEARVEQELDIFRRVIERLSSMRTKENSRATSMVIDSYNARIERVQNKFDLDAESSAQLRSDLVDHELDYLQGLIERGRVDEDDAYPYMRRLNRVKLNLIRDARVPLNTRTLRRFMNLAASTWQRFRARVSDNERHANQLAVQELSLREAQRWLRELLEDGTDRYPTEVITRVLLSRQELLRTITSNRPGITAYAVTAERSSNVERLAYKLELEEIQRAQAEGKISRAHARTMRQNVYLMMVDLDVLGED